MIFTSLAVAAAATSKWLITGKIMVAVATGLMTAGPVIEQKRKERG